MKILSIMFLFAIAALAQGDATLVPEINANSAAGAIALLSGALVVLRSRRKK
jgi:LPXTG-motif cell wall-anchored protein